MEDYRRPSAPPLVFRDAAGEAIDYGNRWAAAGGPPEDSYSVIEHPERFAPLHAVAEALIDHLAATYGARLEEGPRVAAELRHAPNGEEIVRAVRLAPREGEDEDGGSDGSGNLAAPLTFVLTNSPAVHLFAGVLFHGMYPSCLCNACDERWDTAADELERHVFTIVGGGFSEDVGKKRRAKWSYDRGHGLVKGMGQTVSYRLRALDDSWGESGAQRARDVPAELIEAVAEVSARGNWQAWPAIRPR